MSVDSFNEREVDLLLSLADKYNLEDWQGVEDEFNSKVARGRHKTSHTLLKRKFNNCLAGVLVNEDQCRCAKAILAKVERQRNDVGMEPLESIGIFPDENAVNAPESPASTVNTEPAVSSVFSRMKYLPDEVDLLKRLLEKHRKGDRYIWKPIAEEFNASIGPDRPRRTLNTLQAKLWKLQSLDRAVDVASVKKVTQETVSDTSTAVKTVTQETVNETAKCYRFTVNETNLLMNLVKKYENRGKHNWTRIVQDFNTGLLPGRLPRSKSQLAQKLNYIRDSHGSDDSDTTSPDGKSLRTKKPVHSTTHSKQTSDMATPPETSVSKRQTRAHHSKRTRLEMDTAEDHSNIPNLESQFTPQPSVQMVVDMLDKQKELLDAPP